MHPRSKHWHLLDYVITRACDVADVHLTRVMRGAECWTEHRLVVSKFQLKLCKQRPQKRLNVRACRDPATQENLQKKVSDLLWNSAEDSMSNVTDCQSLKDEWSSLCSSIIKLATESLGFSSKKHQDLSTISDMSSLVCCMRKTMLTMRCSAIQTQPVCVKDGRNCATRYKRTFARWRINGGLRRPKRYIVL